MKAEVREYITARPVGCIRDIELNEGSLKMSISETPDSGARRTIDIGKKDLIWLMEFLEEAKTLKPEWFALKEDQF